MLIDRLIDYPINRTALVVRWSENSERFEKSYGNWLPAGPNSARFYLSVCDMAGTNSSKKKKAKFVSWICLHVSTCIQNQIFCAATHLPPPIYFINGVNSYLKWNQTWMVGWLCWGLTSQSTIFQSCWDGAIASWVINQYFRGVKCLAQGHNTANMNGFINRLLKNWSMLRTFQMPLICYSWISSDATLVKILGSKTETHSWAGIRVHLP